MKITPHEKRRHAARREKNAACRLFSRRVSFTSAHASLALLSLRKNGGLFVVYLKRYLPAQLDLVLNKVCFLIASDGAEISAVFTAFVSCVMPGHEFGYQLETVDTLISCKTPPEKRTHCKKKKHYVSFHMSFVIIGDLKVEVQVLHTTGV